MNYNKRIDENFLRADYVDGEVLQHSDLNELESVVKTAINANYEDIQKLQDGTLIAENATKFNGATLSKYSTETLQNSDTKVPSSMQTKQYVDAAISSIDLSGYASKVYVNGKIDDTVAIYDSNGNGIVDNAEKVNNHTVDKDVPSDAKFTDTLYDDTEVRGLISGLDASKVDKVSGKGLSTNDYTNAEKTKLSGIANGAQVNAIEKIKVNGVQQTITSKVVDISVPTQLSQLSGDATHRVVTDSEKLSWNNKGSYSKPSGGIPKTDLASAVQTSLGKADSAIQDVSDKEDKANKVTSLSSSSTDTQYPGAKTVYDSQEAQNEVINALETELENTKEELDYYKTLENVLPKITGTGTELTLNNTADSILRLTPKASAMEQATTLGTNLIGLDTQQYKVNLSVGDKIVAKNTGTRNLQLNLYTNYGDTNRNDYWSVSSGQTKVITVAYNTKAISWDTEPNGEAWVNLGETILDYEPYTGSIPAPNTDFPMQIHTISGDNKVVVEGKNILTEQPTPYSATAQYSPLFSNDFQVNLKSGENYTLSIDTENTGISCYFQAVTGISLTYKNFTCDGTRKYVNFTATQDLTQINKSMVSRGSDTSTTSAGSCTNVMISKGTATDTPSYEPHEEQVVNIPLGVKNLFDKDNVETGKYYKTSEIDISSNWNIFQAQVQPNTNYYLSGNNYNNNTAKIVLLDSSKNILSSVGGYKDTHLITTSATTKYIGLSCHNDDLVTLQLEKGTKSNSYSPYGQEPLKVCKMPNTDYEDEFILNINSNNLFDKENSEFISKIIDGNTRWGYKLPKTNANFYISRLPNNAGYGLYEDANGTFNLITSVTDEKTLVNSNTNDLYILCRSTSNRATALDYFNNINVMMSYKNMPYEPYTDNKWYLKEKLLKVILKGTETINTNNQGDDFISFVLNDYTETIETSVANSLLCNMLQPVTSGTNANTCRIASSGRVVLNFAPNFCNYSGNAIKSKLAELYNNNNPLILYIPLKDVTYTLLNDTLQNALNTLQEKLLAYKDQTNISQVNNDLPFTFSASALMDLTNLTIEDGE